MVSLLRWKTLVAFELKSLRLFMMQIILSMIVIPLLLLLLLLYQPGSRTPGQLTILLTGYLVTSLMGAYITVYATRVANLMLPEVLELHAVLPWKTEEIISVGAIVYTLMVLPQIVIATTILALHAPGFPMFTFARNLFLIMLSLIVWSIWLGLHIKYYVAVGILPFMSWVLLLISPIYYDVAIMPKWASFASVLNPLLHWVLLLRQPLQGGNLPFPIEISWGITLLLLVVLLVDIRRRSQSIYILETL